MDSKTYQYIQDNIPEASSNQINDAYVKHNGDLLNTLIELLKIPEKIPSPKTEWEKRRELCDEYDTEMQKRLQDSVKST